MFSGRWRKETRWISGHARLENTEPRRLLRQAACFLARGFPGLREIKCVRGSTSAVLLSHDWQAVSVRFRYAKHRPQGWTKLLGSRVLDQLCAHPRAGKDAEPVIRGNAWSQAVR